MKRLLAPGTRKLFLHNLLWLELITHSVHRMILLLKTVSLRAYLFPLLAKTFGVPAARKAKRSVASLGWCSAASLACLSASAVFRLQETLLWEGRMKKMKNHWHLGSWSASSCILTSERWIVPLSSEGLCWNLTTCLPALLDHTRRGEASPANP